MSGIVNERVVEKAARLCRERGIVVPTFAQLRDPRQALEAIRRRLPSVAMDAVDPANLFRITWKNDPAGRGFNDGNWIEFPSALTGVPARIIGLVGKHFPTGAHKVGAAFGCLAPRLVSGEFDPTTQKAVWPSTGNYCRGGAFDCALLGCTAVAILPEEMSAERFEWLASIGAEVIKTPGGESNVKEIYDKCWEIRHERKECVIFNQFEEFGNAAWHFHTTGAVVEEIFAAMGISEVRSQKSEVRNEATDAVEGTKSPGSVGSRKAVAERTGQGFGAGGCGNGGLGADGLRFAGWVSATGSAGTIAAGDYLRRRFPSLRVVVAEALQCPTLLRCGFGEHRIEGIGDKHVPWIHNVRNTDMVAAVDDEQCLRLMRLFNEDAGRAALELAGVARGFVEQLGLVGISGICNLVAAIKAAKYYEMDGRDVIFMPLTDSMDLYGSRVAEMRGKHGVYTDAKAGADFARYMEGIGTDNLRELGYWDRKALHNLKYFTWVEQQGKSARELDALWSADFWAERFGEVEEWDRMIVDFNRRVAG